MTRARLFGALAAALMVVLAGCDDGSLPPGGTYGSVSGVVLDDATKQPVAGAVVTVDTVLTMTTGADGKFSFSSVPSGDFDYAVQADGYKNFTSPGHVDPGKSLALTVTLSH